MMYLIPLKEALAKWTLGLQQLWDETEETPAQHAKEQLDKISGKELVMSASEYFEVAVFSEGPYYRVRARNSPDGVWLNAQNWTHDDLESAKRSANRLNAEAKARILDDPPEMVWKADPVTRS